jgi:hypothetical protein
MVRMIAVVAVATIAIFSVMLMKLAWMQPQRAAQRTH